MPDYGARMADRKIKKVDRHLTAIYRQAEKELMQKLSSFVKRYASQDKAKRIQLQEGKITEAQYKNWLQGQVFQKKQWESKVKQVQQVMNTHNVQAAKIVHQNKLDVFAENYNYTAFHSEMATGISFNMVNAQTVSQLVKDHPQLLPEWKIDQEKDYKWIYKKVNNSITQGILQGESVDKIAKRLTENLCTQNENKMRMFARTAITEAQNAGRQAQMEEATKKGIEVHKEWVATLDGRTRDAHRQLDGQEVPFDKPFDSELGKIMFPGDPSADPANVYNCRCTMISIYPKYRQQDNWRENEKVDGQSYREWKEGKKKEQAVGRSFTAPKKQDKMGIDLQKFAEKDLEKQSDDSIRKGIKSLKEAIAEHKKKIAHPEEFDWWKDTPQETQEGIKKHWKKEIENFEESIKNREDELKRRGK